MRIPRPKMFAEAEKNNVPSSLPAQIFIFIGVFIVIMLVESIFSSIFAMPAVFAVALRESSKTVSFDESYTAMTEAMSEWNIMVPTLLCTIFGTILSIVYCRFIEGRSLGSMGMRKKHLIPRYLLGLIVGILLMGLAAGLAILTGVSEIKLLSDFNVGIILLFFLGFFVQGMSEEFIFRGYLMNTIGGKHSVAAALAVSSIAFAVAHAANPGVTPLAFLNLALFGLFAGLYMICFDDIWGVSAIHTIWNFMQGNFLGISVSGTGEIDSVFRTSPVSSHVWLTGGKFGIEGSIFTTIVLTAASLIVLLKIKKSSVSTPVESSAE